MHNPLDPDVAERLPELRVQSAARLAIAVLLEHDACDGQCCRCACCTLHESKPKAQLCPFAGSCLVWSQGVDDEWVGLRNTCVLCELINQGKVTVRYGGGFVDAHLK